MLYLYEKYFIEKRIISVVFTATSLAVALAASGVSGFSAIWLCRNQKENELEAQAEEIMDEYLLNVQKVNYQMIKEHVEKRSDMQIESEAILEDNTILLTIQL